MDWRVKAAAQGALARCVGGRRVNDLLQRLAGQRRDTARHVASKVHDDWLVHASNLRELGFSLDGKDMLEIGTGWIPVMPLCFALAGVRRCHTFDVQRHLGAGAVTLGLRHLAPHLTAIADAAGADPAAVRDRWDRWLRLPDDAGVLDAAGITYHAPADATASGLPGGSVALVFSNTVLEHVPAATVAGLMRETRRVLAPGGVALHSVNCGDHYAYFDRSITPIHYLRFSAAQWRRWNNDLLYQNRLRPLDFTRAACEAGLAVVMDKHRPRPELLARLPALPIAEEFRAYAPEQLCSTSIDFAAVRAASAESSDQVGAAGDGLPARGTAVVVASR